MASLREIRQKIKSIKSTQKITKAMKMVAAARLRRAQARILAARPFATKMEEMVVNLLDSLEGETATPLFLQRAVPGRVLVLITSDKGLCGAFNTNLIRQAILYLKKYGHKNVQLFIVGKKGRDYFRRINASIVKDYTGIFNALSFAHAEIIADDVTSAFLTQPVAAVDLMYSEFKSVIQQQVVTKKLLPLSAPEKKKSSLRLDYIFEPAPEKLIQSLLPRFIKAQVFRALLESNASELGSRMTAMDNATRNAAELLSSLTLRLNRTRQASITKEILEVVGGAEALR